MNRLEVVCGFSEQSGGRDAEEFAIRSGVRAAARLRVCNEGHIDKLIGVALARKILVALLLFLVSCAQAYTLISPYTQWHTGKIYDRDAIGSTPDESCTLGATLFCNGCVAASLVKLGVGWYRCGIRFPDGAGNSLDVTPLCPSGSTYYTYYDACLSTVAACPVGQVADSSGICRPAPTIDDDQTSQPGGAGKACYGNPIYPLDGTKHQKEEFGRWAGGEVLVEYDSRGKSPGASSALVPLASFGGLWQSQLHRRLLLQRGTSGDVLAVQASRGGAQWVSFKKDANGSYAAPAGIDDRLSTTAGGWRYVDARARAVEEYDASGLLTAVSPMSGGRQSYEYSTSATASDVAPAAGLLLIVTDLFGRSVRFAYEAAGEARVRTVSEPDGATTVVGYDTAGNMAALQRADGKARRFLYENTALPWALTGVEDENGDRQSTFGYDAEGRAISTERAGGVDRYSVTYDSPPAVIVSSTFDTTTNVTKRVHRWQLPQGTTLTTPAGTAVNLEATLLNGMPRMTTRSQPAGAGCDAATSTLSYDANGNVSSRTDFNGTKSCYAYDLSRNLETARIDGLSAADACPADIGAFAIATEASRRKTTTQWHPAWSLPIKQAEPKKITISVYNGQPAPTAGNATASCAPSTALLPDGSPIAVLCKKIEQATTDATGSLGFGATTTGTPRTWTYTYNQYGQVLTASDPLNKLTTYVYYSDTTDQHTLGDLQSVTDPAGKQTQYTRYDKSGRLMQSIDPNGTVTDTTYTPRGWVKTVTVTPAGGAAQLTIYDYDGVGQLKKASLPDSTALEYTYDAAHRLTTVKDNAGNSVTYTLDNMGNRTGEDLKDPSGTLARNITRVYDALNRAQSTTGATQ